MKQKLKGWIIVVYETYEGQLLPCSAHYQRFL